MAQIGKWAIPDDWTESDGHRLVVFCVPDSREWRTLVTGHIESLSYGRNWDELTGSVKAAQEMARNIFESMDMTCGEDIKRIADTLETWYDADHLDIGDLIDVLPGDWGSAAAAYLGDLREALALLPGLPSLSLPKLGLFQMFMDNFQRERAMRRQSQQAAMLQAIAVALYGPSAQTVWDDLSQSLPLDDFKALVTGQLDETLSGLSDAAITLLGGNYVTEKIDDVFEALNGGGLFPGNVVDSLDNLKSLIEQQAPLQTAALVAAITSTAPDFGPVVNAINSKQIDFTALVNGLCACMPECGVTGGSGGSGTLPAEPTPITDPGPNPAPAPEDIPPGFPTYPAYADYKCSVAAQILEEMRLSVDRLKSLDPAIVGGYSVTTLTIAITALIIGSIPAVLIAIAAIALLAQGTGSINLAVIGAYNAISNHYDDHLCALYTATSEPIAEANLRTSLEAAVAAEVEEGLQSVTMTLLAMFVVPDMLNRLFDDTGLSYPAADCSGCAVASCAPAWTYSLDTYLGSGDLSLDGQVRTLSSVQHPDQYHIIAFANPPTEYSAVFGIGYDGAAQAIANCAPDLPQFQMTLVTPPNDYNIFVVARLDPAENDLTGDTIPPADPVTGSPTVGIEYTISLLQIRADNPFTIDVILGPTSTPSLADIGFETGDLSEFDEVVQ